MIQNTQNRDSEAMHLKLDEIIRAVVDADNKMIDLEDLADDEFAKLHQHFTTMAAEAAKHVDARGLAPVSRPQP